MSRLRLRLPSRRRGSVDAAGPSASLARRGGSVALTVLHVDGSTEWRGGQRQLQLLSEGLSARVVRQVVLCPRDSALVSRLAPGLHRPLPRRGGRRALQEAVAQTRADVVAVHDRRGLQLIPRGGVGAAVVVHRRVDFVPGRLSWRRYRRADHVVAVSEAVARIMRRVLGRAAAVDVVLDGVHAPTPVPLEPPGTRDLLAVGALVPHKGHRTLIDAVALLEPCRLTIAGEGPLLGALRRQARRRGVADRVRFVGHVANLDALRAQAALFVHPSHTEGLGQAVLESLLAGLPVVASAAGGLPEILHGRGTLVPPARPRRLASAIERGHRRGEAERERLAAQRPALVQALGVDRMVEATLAAYDRARRPGSPTLRLR